MDGETTTRQTPGGQKALVWLFAGSALVLLFFNLGGYRTFGRHEARAVVPAREMLAGADWTIPRFAGEPRLTKPPLVYWTLATIGNVCGEISEFTARLPQAIAAVLLCALMGAWANRWYGREAGWTAAFVQLTSAWVLVWGRKAEIDMTIWLLTTAALFLIATQPETETGRRNFLRWVGVFALLAVAWLGKFHYALAMVCGPAAIYFVVRKRYRDLWNFANPVGLLIFAAAVVVWPMLVLREMPGAWEIWFRETVGRATGELGRKPFWYYLPRVLSYALPWTPIALLAMRSSWRHATSSAGRFERDTTGGTVSQAGIANERFLWIWLLTHFAIVTLQPNKHSHYVLSALPVFTMFSARWLAVTAERIRSGKWRMTGGWATVLSATVLVTSPAAAVVAIRKWPFLTTPILAMAGLAAIGSLTAILFAMRNRFRSARLIALGVFLGGWMLLVGWIVPARDHRRLDAEFARRSREATLPTTKIIAYRLGEHPVVSYVDGPVQSSLAPDELASKLHAKQPTFVLTFRNWISEIDTLGECRIVAACDHRRAKTRLRHPPLVLVEVRPHAKPIRIAVKIRGDLNRR